MSIVSYAQNFEDVMLWRALGHVENGFYIDIGAQDPVVDSVSLAFYENGWRGVHVEPSFRYAKAIRESRPDEKVYQAAITSFPGSLRFFEFDDSGLSTGNSDVAETHRESGRIDREITVQCLTLDSLFEKIGDVDVHWLKIDVEGMESDVLAGWKESPVRPWLVVVESGIPGSQKQSDIPWEPALLEKGYKPVYYDGVNLFYVSLVHTGLSKAFQSPPNVFDEFILSGKASHSFCLALKHQVHLVEVREADAKRQLHEAKLHQRELEDTRQRVVSLEDQLEMARSQLGLRDREIDQILHSHSWRMTLPLRELLKLIRSIPVYSQRMVGSLSRNGFKALVGRSLKWLARRTAQHPRLNKVARAILKRHPPLFEFLVRRLKHLEPHPDVKLRHALPSDQARLTARARRIHHKLMGSIGTESHS